MNHCRSLAATLSADHDHVFALLSSLENLPAWARRFCRELHREPAGWRMLTPAGERHVALLADATTGVIDLLVGEQPDEMNLVPLRVVRRPRGAAVLATLFRAPGESEDDFERCHAALWDDLRTLIARFGAGRLAGAGLAGEPFYPSVVTARFFETWNFYAEHLGFRTVFESDAYVHLAHAGGAQLGILRHEIDGPRPELISATDGRGYWFNLDVADADAEYARLVAAGVTIAEPIEDKSWGSRQFMVCDPNGVLVAIAHRRPAAETLAAV
ncbi:MAG TPA: VOC family protein [Opitutus sp.]|nr:VOC family protein [Opitutus sp.]